MKKLLLVSAVTFLFLVGCSDDSDSKEIVKEPEIHKEEKPTEDTTKKEDTKSTTPVSSNSDDLTEAFENYLDEIILLAPEEDRLIALYDSVTGVNYQNDEILYYTLLDEIMPGYRQFVIDLEAIMPRNEEIRQLHELYIDAANIQYNSFTLMLFAIEEQDSATITEANEGLDQARKMIRDWLYGMEKLASEAGVSLQ